MTPPAVSVEGLWEAYHRRNKIGRRRRGRSRWALRDVSFSLGRGETLGVIGGNGSGKTTLLQVLAGVLTPTRGRVETTGRVASLVDLSAGFHRDLTGAENLRIGGVLLGLSRSEVRERLDEIVAFSGLDSDAVDTPLSAYSAGMGLRLGFSLVVHSDPDVLLVDEVLAVGDDSFQQQCVARIDALRGAGTAVVVVSHDLGMISAHADVVGVLDGGSLSFLGEPDAAIDHYLRNPAAPETGAASARLFESSPRARAARRRKGV